MSFRKTSMLLRHLDYILQKRISNFREYLSKSLITGPYNLLCNYFNSLEFQGPFSIYLKRTVDKKFCNSARRSNWNFIWRHFALWHSKRFFYLPWENFFSSKCRPLVVFKMKVWGLILHFSLPWEGLYEKTLGDDLDLLGGNFTKNPENDFWTFLRKLLILFFSFFFFLFFSLRTHTFGEKNLIFYDLLWDEIFVYCKEIFVFLVLLIF